MHLLQLLKTKLTILEDKGLGVSDLYRLVEAGTPLEQTLTELSHKTISEKNEALLLIETFQTGSFLLNCTPDLQADKELVETAVSTGHLSGLALKHASADLQNDKDVVLQAVSNTALAFGYASEALQNDLDVRVIAELSTEPAELKEFIAQNPTILDGIKENLAGAASPSAQTIKEALREALESFDSGKTAENKQEMEL